MKKKMLLALSLFIGLLVIAQTVQCRGGRGGGGRSRGGHHGGYHRGYRGGYGRGGYGYRRGYGGGYGPYGYGYGTGAAVAATVGTAATIGAIEASRDYRGNEYQEPEEMQGGYEEEED